jgi:hypothetical protein
MAAAKLHPKWRLNCQNRLASNGVIPGNSSIFRVLVAKYRLDNLTTSNSKNTEKGIGKLPDVSIDFGYRESTIYPMTLLAAAL